jgi:hydroxylamine reductase (hybrid-cluster protein)
VGQPFFGHLLALQKKVQDRTEGKKVNLWLQGTRGVPIFPSFPDHGSPEIALTMGLDALIIYPNAYLPSLEGLARKWEIPVLLPEEARTIESFVEEAIDMALGHRKKNGPLPASRVPFPAALPRASIFDRAKEVQAALNADRVRGILLIWSEPNVKQAFFERTLTLMETALNRELLVLVGGDAVAQANLLNEELARRTGKKTDDISGTGIRSLNYLTCWAETPKLIALLHTLNSKKEFSQMPVVVAFPEFSRTSTWAAAVSFLSLGFSVQLGTQLPFWGSPSLAEVILKDWPAVSGGILLTSPSLPEGHAQAQEMISHIQSRSF